MAVEADAQVVYTGGPRRGGDVPDDRRVLTLPKVERAEYERNFVKNAVCELRFPTLLELESRPPDALQKALRKEYPLYERAHALTGFTVGVAGAERQTQLQHQLKSKDKKWTVLFRSSSVALESTAYRGFDDFMVRLTWVLRAVRPIIDSDFFTRIGLRYINALPFSEVDFDGWVNPALAGTLVSGPFGEVSAFWQQAQGPAERGWFSFRHGLPEAEGPKREYILDFDFYDENIDVAEAEAAINALHEQSYRFFCWAVGPKTIAAMGLRKGAKK